MYTRLQQQNDQLRREVDELKKEQKSRRDFLDEILAERADLLEKVKQLETDLSIKEKTTEVQVRAEPGSSSTTRNIRRQVQRKNKLLAELKQRVKGMKKEMEDQRKKEATKQKQLEKQRDRMQRRASYYKKKSTSDFASRRKMQELNDELRYREEQMALLEERLEDMINKECGKVSTMVKGKYKDSIRSVYQHLMCLNVGSNNCEDIVRTVLKDIAGLDVERLPKATFAKDMVFEARAMAQLQLCHEVLEGDNLTLCSDGTTRFGHHFGSYDIGLGEGKVFTLGVRETADGTAVTTLTVLKEIVQDLVDLGGQDRLNLGLFLTKIKNVMSDRHSVQKKFNGLLADFRGKFLPAVSGGWDKMSLTQREKAQELNEFFCGMHFVVGLAEQASSTLKAWEQMVFGEEKVGAQLVTGFAGKDESGTERLVRTVCQGVQDRGCEKSGKAAQFRAFLSAEHGVNSVPLAPFKGNRFNILFHNGAGVYHMFNHLSVFCNRHKSENELMLAVAADLEVPQYIAGVRSLGIIDKAVTGPLWRAMEKEQHVLAMNERYDRLLQCLTKWSSDSTDLMRGKDILYPDVPVKKDSVYDSLMKSCELDGMVKQVLEMLCSSFKMLSERMLSEHLKGGKYSSMSADQHRETHSVPTTNTTVERDFGMLDRLMREKPSASSIALEAMIMYRRNQTSNWTASLEESQRSAYLALAQKSKAQQKKAYAERLGTIRATREKKELDKKAAIARKKSQDHTRKLLLGKDIKAVGGLAESHAELDQKLSELTSMKSRSTYLQTQLKYRRYVLGTRNKGGVLNLSVSGKSKTVEELKASLLSVMESDNKHLEEASSSLQNVAVGLAPVDAVEAFKSRLQPPAAKRARPTEGSNIKVPEELVGKRIEHHREEDGQVDWYKGTVVGSKGSKCFLRYDGFPHVYSFSVKDIEEEIQCGDLRVLVLNPGDMLNEEVMHLWLVNDEEIWCKGVVVSFNKDEGNDTLFEVVYTNEDPQNEDEDDVFECHLLQDYLKHELRFV